MYLGERLCAVVHVMEHERHQNHVEVFIWQPADGSLEVPDADVSPGADSGLGSPHEFRAGIEPGQRRLVSDNGRRTPRTDPG